MLPIDAGNCPNAEIICRILHSRVKPVARPGRQVAVRILSESDYPASDRDVIVSRLADLPRIRFQSGDVAQIIDIVDQHSRDPVLIGMEQVIAAVSMTAVRPPTRTFRSYKSRSWLTRTAVMVSAWFLPVFVVAARTFCPGLRDEMGTALPSASSTLVLAVKLSPPQLGPDSSPSRAPASSPEDPDPASAVSARPPDRRDRIGRRLVDPRPGLRGVADHRPGRVDPVLRGVLDRVRLILRRPDRQLPARPDQIRVRIIASPLGGCTIYGGGNEQTPV
jgi:hypothetical protein